MVEQREVPEGFHVHKNGGGLVEDTAHSYVHENL